MLVVIFTFLRVAIQLEVLLCVSVLLGSYPVIPKSCSRFSMYKVLAIAFLRVTLQLKVRFDVYV